MRMETKRKEASLDSYVFGEAAYIC